MNPETRETKKKSPMTVSAYCLEESFQAMEQERETEVKPCSRHWHRGHATCAAAAQKGPVLDLML